MAADFPLSVHLARLNVCSRWAAALGGAGIERLTRHDDELPKFRGVLSGETDCRPCARWRFFATTR